MFRWLRRSPEKKLEADYRQILEEARDLQRQGDIQGFALKMRSADEVAKEIAALEASAGRTS